MKNKQLKLDQLKINSFLTSIKDETLETVKGGEPYFTIKVCESLGKECITHLCPVTQVGCI